MIRAMVFCVKWSNVRGPDRAAGVGRFVRLMARCAPVLTALLLLMGIHAARCETPGDPGLQPVPVEVPGLQITGPAGPSNMPALAGGNERVDPVFHAVKSKAWPAGLVPIFGFERRGIFQLSRTPKTGWENLLDPVFFALPRADETNAHALAGGWSMKAVHEDGHSDELRWELTTEGEQVAGRMDPDTDYRFATVSGGTWTGNRLQLKVDYINDHFELSGRLVDGMLSGRWRRTDDGDRGEWRATRSTSTPVVDASTFRIAPLYEWTHRTSGLKRYSLDSTGVDSSWRRTEAPICRVWVTPGAPMDDEPQVPQVP